MKVAIYLFLFLLFTGSCTPNNAQQPETKIEIPQEAPSRWQLRRNFYDKGEVLFVYGADSESIKSQYKLLLDKIVQKQIGRRSRTIKVSFKSSEEVSGEDIKNNVVYLIGTPQHNKWIEQLTVHYPLSFSGNAFEFNGVQFSETTDVLAVSSYPNPENQNLPFLLLTGNSELAVFNQLQSYFDNNSLLSQTMDIEIRRDMKKMLLGGFDRSWQVDEDAFFDYSEKPVNVLSTKYFDFISVQSAISESEASALSEIMHTSTDKILDFVGPKNKDLPKIKIYVYPTAEDKGMLIGDTQHAQIDKGEHSASIVYNDKYKANYLQLENMLTISRLLGDPSEKVLEKGLSIYFTNHWQREGYLYWAARLIDADYTFTLSDFFNEEAMEYESPLIKDCYSGLVVSFLIEQWGEEKFKQQYASWKPQKSELKKLEKKWESYMRNIAKRYPKKPSSKPKLDYVQGFNFAHEGYNIYNGYLSKMATSSLEKQAQLGANAIAIVPYGSMSDATKATPLRIYNHAGSENIAGVIHSAYEAKQLGMVSMLKPQIWLRRAWPGAIKMNTDEQWDQFFKYYHSWIMHFAFLAEIHNIEMFCAGVEFAHATLAKEEEWRKILGSIKKLYHGQLTYAANWGYEFEQIKFWDEVDFIGLNCYYPLSESDTPSDRELKSRFEGVKDKIKKVYKEYQKPIVFTEIGFRSIPAPWKNPHAEDSEEYKAEDQARCYEVVFEGIKNEPWCAGILWWKYPSYLSYRGVENNAFTPNNKPAEKVVAKWFMK